MHKEQEPVLYIINELTEPWSPSDSKYGLLDTSFAIMVASEEFNIVFQEVTTMFGDLFGGMFDFNGDGNTDFGEEMLGMVIIDDMSNEEMDDDSIQVEITITKESEESISISTDDEDVEELRDEIESEISDLEDLLSDLEDAEPDENNCDAHEEWEERVDELEDKISELEDKLDELDLL